VPQDCVVCLPLLWITSSADLHDDERALHAVQLHKANERVYGLRDLLKEQKAAKERANAAPWDVSDDETKDVADGDVQEMNCDGGDAVPAQGITATGGVRRTRAKRTRDVSAATEGADDVDGGRAPKRPKKRGGGRKQGSAGSAVDDAVSSAAETNSALSDAPQVPAFLNSVFINMQRFSALRWTLRLRTAMVLALLGSVPKHATCN
jgi:hypothetical protein